MSGFGNGFMRAIDPLNLMGDGGWFGKPSGGMAPAPKIPQPSVGDPDTTMGTNLPASSIGNAASSTMLSNNTQRSKLLS